MASELTLWLTLTEPWALRLITLHDSAAEQRDNETKVVGSIPSTEEALSQLSSQNDPKGKALILKGPGGAHMSGTLPQ